MLGALRSKPNFVNKPPDTGEEGGYFLGIVSLASICHQIFQVLFGNDDDHDVWHSVNRNHYDQDDDEDDVDDVDDLNDDVEIG